MSGSWMRALRESRSPVTAAFFVVMLVASALRLAGLDRYGFNRDEIATLQFSGPDIRAVLFGPDFDNHPPLYYLLVHFWALAFGNSEVALRLLSVLISLGVIWLSFDIGRRLLNAQAGLLAAALLALLPPHLYYAQFARMYELLLLCALLSTWALAGYLTRGGPARAVAYVLATVAMLYTQTAGVFYVLAQNLFFVIATTRWEPVAAWPRRYLAWIGTQVAILLLFLPWLLVLAGQVDRLQGSFWVARESIVRYLGGTFLIFSGSTRYPGAYAVALVLAALIGLATIPAARWWVGRADRAAPGYPGPQWGFGLAAATALLPGLAMAALSQVAQPIFVPRAVLPSAVAIYWMAGAGLACLPRWPKMAAVAVIVLAAASTTAQFLRIDPPDYEEDARRSALAVARVLGPEDVLFVNGWPAAQAYFIASARRADLAEERLPRVVGVTGTALRDAAAQWCPAPATRRFVVLAVEPVPLPVPLASTIAAYEPLLRQAGLTPSGKLPGLDPGVPAVVWGCDGASRR